MLKNEIKCPQREEENENLRFEEILSLSSEGHLWKKYQSGFL